MELAGNLLLIFSFALTLLSLWMIVILRPATGTKEYKLLHYFYLSIFTGISLAIGCLVYLLLKGDMQIELVALHTNHGLPWIYRLSALWAGQSGSLLFWSFIHVSFSTLVWLRYRNRHPEWQRPSGIILLIIQLFFLGMNIWVLNPYRVMISETPDSVIPFIPTDGQGLNPLLQHPAMVLHPPLLFIGYAGSAVVFSISASALWIRTNENWFTLIRPWLLFTWLFLTAGIGLGAWWAYAELGWGGYWAWDPVENASLMPWLLATALIHTLILRKQKGLLSVTSLILAAAYFFFCLLGTFITRSGLINSVHAFSQSSVGVYFLLLLCAIFLLTFFLILNRRRFFSNNNTISAFTSMESMTVLLTITMVIFCVAVLAGTLFPTLAGQVFGKTIMLDAFYYNRLTRFLIIILLLIMIVSQCIQLRQVHRLQVRTLFILCSISSVSAITVAVAFSGNAFFGLIFGILFTAFLFIVLKVIYDYKLSSSLPALNKHSTIASLILFRGGSVLTHIGFLWVCFGVSGSLMDQSVIMEGRKNQSFDYLDLRFTIDDFNFDQSRLYESLTARILLTEKEQQVFAFTPEYRYYYANRQTSTEVSVYSSMFRDIYAVLLHYDADLESARFQIYFNPLVSWIWTGCILIITGAGLALSNHLSSNKNRRHE